MGEKLKGSRAGPGRLPSKKNVNLMNMDHDIEEMSPPNYNNHGVPIKRKESRTVMKIPSSQNLNNVIDLVRQSGEMKN